MRWSSLSSFVLYYHVLCSGDDDNRPPAATTDRECVGVERDEVRSFRLSDLIYRPRSSLVNYYSTAFLDDMSIFPNFGPLDKDSLTHF